jgi:hypothetical protein
MSTVMEEVQKIWDYNMQCLPPRKIQYERAGSHTRARYQGEQTFTLGATRSEARQRLEFWAERGKHDEAG